MITTYTHYTILVTEMADGGEPPAKTQFNEIRETADQNLDCAPKPFSMFFMLVTSTILDSFKPFPFSQIL